MAREVLIGTRKFYIVSEPDGPRGWMARVLEVNASIVVRYKGDGTAEIVGRHNRDGIDVFREPMASRKRLGVLPDVHGLYPRLTPREHVRYFAELHGMPARRVKAMMSESSWVLPEFDISNAASLAVKKPRSPWLASPG